LRKDYGKQCRTWEHQTAEDVEAGTIIERIRAKKSALSVMEFAKMMGTGKAKIYRMVKAGRLPAIQFGDAGKFDPKVIADWLEERTVAA
jgi:excisionase family DNA binding protein